MIFHKVGGVETCFNKINWCNLHPQCDSAKDELDCDYRKKGLIPKKATFRCQSPHHNEDSVKANRSRGIVYIHAVLQDGNSECWKGEDEIERSTNWVSYYLPGLEYYQILKPLTIGDHRNTKTKRKRRPTQRQIPTQRP